MAVRGHSCTQGFGNARGFDTEIFWTRTTYYIIKTSLSSLKIREFIIFSNELEKKKKQETVDLIYIRAFLIKICLANGKMALPPPGTPFTYSHGVVVVLAVNDEVDALPCHDTRCNGYVSLFSCFRRMASELALTPTATGAPNRTNKFP